MGGKLRYDSDDVFDDFPGFAFQVIVWHFFSGFLSNSKFSNKI